MSTTRGRQLSDKTYLEWLVNFTKIAEDQASQQIKVQTLKNLCDLVVLNTVPLRLNSLVFLGENVVLNVGVLVN